MNNLERFYEKFDEDKRLKRRHGEVEFFVTLEFIKKYLKRIDNPKIADIGAGTGVYSEFFADNCYDITAVEYTKKNLQVLRSKQKNIKSFLGDAKNLSMLNNDTFDITLVFGPMYHATSLQDKQKILKEAKRITKQNGIIFVAYLTNDYAVVLHGFKDNNILNAIKDGRLDSKFNVISKSDDLFSYDSIRNINKYNKMAGLKRVKIFAPDGPSDYMRDVLNAMDNQTFEVFKKYQLTVAERKDLLGASSHLVDILKK